MSFQFILVFLKGFFSFSLLTILFTACFRFSFSLVYNNNTSDPQDWIMDVFVSENQNEDSHHKLAWG